MSSNNDRNHVSIGFWMLALLVMSIPILNFVMCLWWAFAGDNESRKNYFRAIILWFAVLFFLGCLFLFLMVSAAERGRLWQRVYGTPPAQESPGMR